MRHSLFVVFFCLAVSSVALAQTEISGPDGCALHELAAPHPKGLGTIIGIQDAAASRDGIPMREARRGGAIDPNYRNDLRALVQQDDGTVDTFDVSAGMTIHVGDRVRLQGSSRSKTSACSYIPHLIIPDDVPIV